MEGNAKETQVQRLMSRVDSSGLTFLDVSYTVIEESSSLTVRAKSLAKKIKPAKTAKGCTKDGVLVCK